MTNLRLESAYAGATAAILDAVRGAADTIATTYQEDNATVLALLWARVADSFKTRSRNENDGRMSKWRCRFRIYRDNAQDEPYADSDAELPPDRPGTSILTGLPGVADEVAALASVCHPGTVIVGLSQEELDRKLKGLRPTLSRRGGNATWRVPYSTIEATGTAMLARQNGERSSERGWLMRVDIARETETEA